MISQFGISAAGDYLWDKLASENQVVYSQFYNHKYGSAEALAKSILKYIQEPEDDEQDVLEDGHLLIEYAAWQLEDIGAVKITKLTDLLVDGDQDYIIELTQHGKSLCKTGLDFSFRGPEHAIIATPASNWLIDFVEGCSPNESLTLRDVMEYGNSEANIIIKDAYFPWNTYGFGTGSYIWAFEVSLWHHANERNIQPVFKTTQQMRDWIKMQRHMGRPDLPSPHFDNPMWDIPFRLRDGINVDKMNHVGRVSEM